MSDSAERVERVERVVLITGATGGLGRVVAATFAADGARHGQLGS